MAQRSMKATTSRTPVATTSVIRLAATELAAKSPAIPEQREIINEQNHNGNTKKATLMVTATTTTTLTDTDTDDGASATTDDSTYMADTTKMIESDEDCSRTILVDTKTLNRQKELDERYGG